MTHSISNWLFFSPAKPLEGLETSSFCQILGAPSLWEVHLEVPHRSSGDLGHLQGMALLLLTLVSGKVHIGLCTWAKLCSRFHSFLATCFFLA